MVKRLDSACHSNNFSNKLELIKILAHQETGKRQMKTSPHLPCGLNDETILGLNFNVLYLKVLAKNK